MIAYTFHFPPNDIWEMTIDELEYWLERAKQSYQIFHGVK
ncbi:MAG: GpE family phage tail protein [Oligoflexales bacterium]